MRPVNIFAAVAALALGGPVFAQASNSDYSNNNMNMSAHYTVGHPSTLHRQFGHRQHALGSMRNPTVGNTANQRVNGG